MNRVHYWTAKVMSYAGGISAAIGLAFSLVAITSQVREALSGPSEFSELAALLGGILAIVTVLALTLVYLLRTVPKQPVSERKLNQQQVINPVYSALLDPEYYVTPEYYDITIRQLRAEPTNLSIINPLPLGLCRS